MKTRKITIMAPNGLHARPVSEIVRAVKSYTGTTVTVATPAKTVSAASMLGILSLGLKAGTEIEIAADGPQEEEALTAILSLLDRVQEASD